MMENQPPEPGATEPPGSLQLEVGLAWLLPLPNKECCCGNVALLWQQGWQG